MNIIKKSISKEPFYIESLDGIRSLAFIIVFVAHCGAGKIIPGGFGVTIFFFLSGYLITTLLRKEFESTGKINYKKFFTRRALRILPSQFIILLIAIILSLYSILPVKINAFDTILQFLNLTNYLQIAGHNGISYGTGVYWSLSIEEHYYLIFPFLFTFLLNRFSYIKCFYILFLLCLIVLIWRIFLVNIIDNYELRIYRGTDTRIDSIIFGCLLGMFLNPKLDNIPFQPSIWKFLFLPISISLLGLTFLLRSPEIKETIRYTIQGIALLPIFICAIKYPNWFLFKGFNSKLIKHFGRLTYVLYLIHVIVLYLVEKYIEKEIIMKSLLAFILCIIIGEIFYLLIEKPMGTLRHKFFILEEEKKKPLPAILEI